MEKLKKNKIKFKKEDLKEGALKLGNIILSSIAIIGLTGVAITAPNAIKLLEYVLPKDDMKRHYKYRANHSLKKLITDGYVQEKILNGKKIFTLTTLGKLHYESLKNKKVKKWDGKWRIISFDIYEKNRKKRDLLRQELHAYGFQMLQKSMWVYPYPCDEYIGLLKSDLSFGKNVQYMLVEYLDIHIELKQRFDL